MTYQEIYDHVINNGFRRHFDCALPGAIYGTDDVSEGILYASSDEEFVKQTSDAAKRFYSGDFGDFYQFDWDIGKMERPFPGREYGEYPSKYGPIQVHREIFRTVIYFPFER